MSSNNSNNLKGFKSNSKLLFNKFLNNISTTNTTTGSTDNRINNSSMMNGSSANGHSALNVITSAAASAVNSIHSMFNNSSNLANVSSSGSSTSSAQHTPNQSEDSIINPNHNQSLNQISMIRSSLSSIGKIEKKHFDKINKLAEKLLKNCQSEKMNLLNSPPYIIDILPDICQLFNTIYIVYENKLHLLNDIEYFCILIRNCLEKFQQLLDLFKVSGKRMYEETSEERQKLVKYTLIYSHILAEMKSIFPKDVYEGQTYRIAKSDAQDFWKNNFNERIVVSWKEFEIKLNRVHKISNNSEADLIRETIQLTKSRHVSIFEFDIFTRLFQPWNNLLNNWKFLVTEHPAYCAFSTYDEVHRRLQKHVNKPGSYLFRLSCTKLGQWAIGYVTSDRKILQTIPQSLVQALIDGQKQNLYSFPDGRDIKIDISSAIAVTSASRIQISQEQYEQYCDVGLSFQVCKICAENNKDRKLEPCGHLICSACLENWQDMHTVSSCPFCRCEIKAFEPIILSPFNNNNNVKTNNTNQLLNENKNIINEINATKNSEILLEKTPSLSSPTAPQLQNDPVTSKTSLNKTYSDKLTPDDDHRPTNKSSNSNLIDQSKYNIDNLVNNDILIAKSPIQTSEVPTTSSKVLENEATNLMTNLVINNNTVLSQISPVLSAPLLPPPPPPPPSISTLPNQQNNSKQNIISSSFGKNSIQLKIENESLFDQLVSMFGNNKLKVACALVLADNDFDRAKEVLLLTASL